MNKTIIITGLVALVGGLSVGAIFLNNNPESTETVLATERNNFMDQNPHASDFVSMRPAIADLPNEALSQEEIDGLLLMREEEKLARDVYQTLYEQWGLQIFSNIAQSEQTHTEAVRDLLVKYELADPVTDDTMGVFKDAALQQLYTDLVAQGKNSEIAALTVGATIEDLDIKDLMDLSAKTDNEDILLVYENLTRGSRNHLRAFTRQLARRGDSYEPRYISESLYTKIIEGNQETGRGKNHGGSGGRGWGGGNGGGRS
jgi:hypothetical protein